MSYEEKVRVLNDQGFEEVESVDVSEADPSGIVEYIQKMWRENTGKQWLADSAMELLGKRKKLHIFLKAGD